VTNFLPPLAFAVLREPFCGFTHLAAAVMSILALRRLQQRVSASDDLAKRRSLAFFGWSLIVLFSASALYHLAELPPAALEWTRRLDHAAIFLLIMGTYTGVCFNALSGAWRRWILGIVWSVGAAGIIMKLGVTCLPEAISTALYVGLGWVGVVIFPILARTFGLLSLSWILSGGFAYTGGAYVDLLQWPSEPWGVLGHHEIFHLAAMLGAFTHFVFISRHVVEFPRVR
jgi:hemolysin III